MDAGRLSSGKDSENKMMEDYLVQTGCGPVRGIPERRTERLFSGESAMPGQDVLNILYRWTIGTAYMMPDGSELFRQPRAFIMEEERSLRRFLL